MSALPGFHALPRSDTIRALAGKEKLSFWKAFMASGKKLFEALESLGSRDPVNDQICSEIEEFICRVYNCNTNIKTLTLVR